VETDARGHRECARMAYQDHSGRSLSANDSEVRDSARRRRCFRWKNRDFTGLPRFVRVTWGQKWRSWRCEAPPWYAWAGCVMGPSWRGSWEKFLYLVFCDTTAGHEALPLIPMWAICPDAALFRRACFGR